MSKAMLLMMTTSVAVGYSPHPKDLKARLEPEEGEKAATAGFVSSGNALPLSGDGSSGSMQGDAHVALDSIRDEEHSTASNEKHGAGYEQADVKMTADDQNGTGSLHKLHTSSCNRPLNSVYFTDYTETLYDVTGYYTTASQKEGCFNLNGNATCDRSYYLHSEDWPCLHSGSYYKCHTVVVSGQDRCRPEYKIVPAPPPPPSTPPPLPTGYTWDFEDGTLQGLVQVSGDCGTQPFTNGREHWWYAQPRAQLGEKLIITGGPDAWMCVFEDKEHAFHIGPDTAVTFMGGNSGGVVTVKECGSDAVLASQRTGGQNHLRSYSISLGDDGGKHAYIEIADDRTGSWGRLLIDNIALSASTPVQACP